jgi:hypothetical protein
MLNENAMIENLLQRCQSVSVALTFALAGAGAGVGVVSSGVPVAGLYKPCPSMYCITGSGTRYLSTTRLVSFYGLLHTSTMHVVIFVEFRRGTTLLQVYELLHDF